MHVVKLKADTWMFSATVIVHLHTVTPEGACAEQRKKQKKRQHEKDRNGGKR